MSLVTDNTPQMLSINISFNISQNNWVIVYFLSVFPDSLSVRLPTCWFKNNKLLKNNSFVIHSKQLPKQLGALKGIVYSERKPYVVTINCHINKDLFSMCNDSLEIYTYINQHRVSSMSCQMWVKCVFESYRCIKQNLYCNGKCQNVWNHVSFEWNLTVICLWGK